MNMYHALWFDVEKRKDTTAAEYARMSRGCGLM